MVRPLVKQTGKTAGAIALNIAAAIIYDQVKGDGEAGFQLVVAYVLIVAAAIAFVFVLRAVARMPDVSRDERPFNNGSRLGRFMNSILGAIAMGSVASAGLSILWLAPIGTARQLTLHVLSVNGAFWNYELGILASIVAPTGLLVRKQRDWAALTACGIASAAAITIVLVAVKPGGNDTTSTFINWLAIIVLLMIFWLLLGGPAIRLGRSFVRATTVPR